MRHIIILVTYFILQFFVTVKAQPNTAGPLAENFSARIVADKLSDPWEVTYGPDGQLWVTEAKGYRVTRIDPVTGKKTLLLDVSNERQLQANRGTPLPQHGLLGMAMHPDLLNGKPFVYIAYIYRFANAVKEGCKPNKGGCFFNARIARYTYDAASGKLTNPVTLCDTIPASNDHNGGRLLIAPVNGKSYLFYSVGDMGAGQFYNGGRPNHAQLASSYEGKTLRFNTEPDSDAGNYDKWIPNNNPCNLEGKQNAVWSIGHRNPQGLAYGVVNGIGRVYECEHGPYSDDELNVIEGGKNYGHPLVVGYADGNYNGLAAGVSNDEDLPGKWHTSYPFIKDELANAKAIGTDYRDPIKSLDVTSGAILQDLYGKMKDGSWDGWASKAPSSVDLYTSNAIPGWKNSLLVTTLKAGSLFRFQLNENGDKITGEAIPYFKGMYRYRDLAISPDGKSIYIAVDSSIVSSWPSKKNPQEVSYRGCIIEFTYTGRPVTERPKRMHPVPQINGTEQKNIRPRKN